MKHHTNINTLPIYNFIECKKGNFQYLYNCSIDKVPAKYPPSFVDIFYNMLYQFDHLDPRFARILNRIARYSNKYIQTLDKQWLNKKNLLIAEYERELELNTEKEQPFMDQFAALKRWTKLDLNIYTTTTAEYYAHLEAYRQFNQPTNGEA